uniref:BACK domain-containing protein n=1 Tax=Parascaris univalens TaxID=6257 RepID=A0A914ZZ41_PARUN
MKAVTAVARSTTKGAKKRRKSKSVRAHLGKPLAFLQQKVAEDRDAKKIVEI